MVEIFARGIASVLFSSPRTTAVGARGAARAFALAATSDNPKKRNDGASAPTMNRLLQMKARGLTLTGLMLAGLGSTGLAQGADVDVQVSSFLDSPDPAIRGGQITYTTVVKNGGPALATDVVVTWPVPATTTFVSVSDGAGGGVCVHNNTAPPGEVTCTYASVAVDASEADWKTISLVVQTTPTTPASINASATATQTGNNDTNAVNNALTQTTTVNAGANLSFGISGAPNPSIGAGNVTWSINGSNMGPDMSGPITVTVPIPGTLIYVSGSGTGWICSYAAPNAVCTRAALTSGAAYGELSIATKITNPIAGGTLTVGGSIAQTGVADPISSNNSGTASVQVNPGLDLAITQDVPSPASANAGAAMTFVLRPTNLGPYPATTGANVSFPLPAGFTLTSAVGTNGWTCSQAGDPIIVTCDSNGSLAPGAGSLLTIVTGAPATVPNSTLYTLTGTVAVNAGGPTDPIPGNNTATRSVTVVPVGLDLSLTKNKTPNIVASGANMTSTIVVHSAAGGVTAASGTITVTDVLNTTHETYISGAGTNWACVEAPVGTVVCTYNAPLNGGANASPLTITTRAQTAGTATNNATSAYSGAPGDYNAANDTIGASGTVTAVGNSPDLIAGISVTTPNANTTLEVNEITVTYVATLTNALATGVSAVDTRMTLTIPGFVSGATGLGVIAVSVPGTSSAVYACTAPNAALTSSTIVCNQTSGTLAAGDVVTFTVPISRGLLDGTFSNGVNVAVTSTSQGDPVPSNNAASATVVIDPIADIELVSKNITSANPSRAGTNVTYVVTIRNNGPSSAATVALSDVFTVPGGDAGFTFISATASDGGTCGGLTANTNYPSGTPTLNCSWASAVNSAETRTVTVVVRPNWMATPPSPRQLGNVASVTTSTAENPTGTDNGNNSKPATLTIDPAQVDALINNTDLVDPLGFDPAATAIGHTTINNDIVYDVAVTNNGPSLASGLGFTYTITPPAGKTIVFRGDGPTNTVASSNTSGTITGSICTPSPSNSVTGPAAMTLTCTFSGPEAQLANQATTRRFLVFRVGTSPETGGDTYNTNATVFTNETDSLAPNNSEAETTTVRRRVDLTIAKTPSLATVQLRQPFNWTITLTNAGPGDSDVTTLTDTLPTGMAFFGTVPSFTTTGAKTGNCGVAGQVLTCNISTGPGAPFVLNEIATVTVPVRMTAYPTVPSLGTARNCASATTDQVDPNSVNSSTVCGDVAVQRSSIAGRVFNDPNSDGIYVSAGAELGLNGWSLALSGTDIYGNPVNLTQNTAGGGAALGTYLFNDLSQADAAGYTLTQTQLATHINGTGDPAAPTLSGTPTLGDQGVYSRGGLAGNTTYTAIKLAGNQVGTNYDFPEFKRPSLSGVVYVDFNTNDTYDSGTDTNIAGATVILRNAADLGNSVATTTTAADGTYTFTNLDPSITYVVEEPLPTSPGGLSNRPTAVNVGTVNGVANGTAAASTPAANTDRITGIDLSSGTDGINYNFGENQTTIISGLVYIDRDRNGQLNGTDTGRIPGVSIELRQGGTSCASATLVGTTTTSANGTYAFPGGNVAVVTPGANYRICELQPVTYSDGGTNPGTSGTTTLTNEILIINLLAGGSVNNNFGERGANLSGFVYQDFGSGTQADDNNGVFNAPGETGIVNVPVTLLNTGTNATVVANTVASGRYDFFDLPFGTYTVTEGAIPPASGTFSNGRTTAGTVGGASTGLAGNDTISGIALTGGADGIDYNFGELRPVEPPAAFPDLVVNKTTPSARTAEGQVLSYSLRVKNAGLRATSGSYTVTDTLPTGTGTPPKWTLESATGTGWTCAIAANRLSVACTNSAVLQPGELNPSAIALTAKVGAGAASFGPLRNVVQVTGGGEPDDKKPQPPELSAPKNCGVLPEFNVCQLETPVDQASPDVVVTKAAGRTVFTEGNLGSYLLRVKNAGATATNGVYTVTDSLPTNSGSPAKWTIEGAGGAGWSCTVSTDKLSVSCAAGTVMQPGAENPSAIAVSVRLASGAVPFGPLRNLVQVTAGGEPEEKTPQPGEVANPPLCSAAPTSNVCYLDTPLQRAAGLSGSVWIDAGIKKVLDPADKRLPQWIVEIYDLSDPAAQGKSFTELVRGGVAKQTVITDSQGYYEVCNLQPESTYRVLFRDPANRIAFPGVVTNEQGRITGADYYSQIQEREGFQVLEVKLPASNGGPGCGGQGVSAPEQSLPLDPNGVVYDANTRAPVPGAKVTLSPEDLCSGYDPQLHIINYETYSKDAQGNPTMTTGGDGFFKFLLSGDPSAPQSCQFRLTVEAPAGYKPAPSTLIGPKPPLVTPSAPGIFNVQPQKPAPTGNEDTSYHFLFNLGLAHQEVFNNHIPLDPFLAGSIVLTKQGDKRRVELGDTLLYTITVRLLEGDPVAQATVRDRLPAGFTLIRGTVRVNNKSAPDPMGGLGPVLGFNLGPLQPNVEAKLTYRVRVGVGAMQGDGVNRARAHACQMPAGCIDPTSLQPLPSAVNSNEGQHKVEVTGGVFTDNACVLGKVFVDCNNNHIQDAEELGIPGVRLYFSDGHFVVSDSEGKYSRCDIAPRSHVLAPDPSTLPLGSRLTTSANRNLGDANSLFIDLKNGELHRADFIEGSCSNRVLEQVKARRAQGEVRSVETEKPPGPALRFLSKPPDAPQQGTDTANQPLVQPRQGDRDAR